MQATERATVETRVGRFELVRELGAGASGVVYEVVDRSSAARFALKMLRDPTPAALCRFKREFRALQGVGHPNLVALHELGVDAGRWFFTMELVAGADFRSWVWARDQHDAGHDDVTAEISTESPIFDEARLRAALGQLAGGVRALHRAGKVHRDLKPSNVRVSGAGRVVILDFGLVIDDYDLLQSGDDLVVGTPAYMAPEQVVGDEVGPAADWYAIGVMLYEALTGALPFEGAQRSMMTERLTVEPPPPSARARRGRVPADLDALCADLLRVDPRARPTGPEIRTRLEGDGGRPSARAISRGAAAIDRVAKLVEGVERARGGEPTAICVIGPAGAGKTTLLRTIAAAAATRPRAAVITARCCDGDRLPFAGLDAVVDGLARVLAAMPLDVQDEVVRGDTGVLVASFPVLCRVDALADATLDVERDPIRLAWALGGVLHRLARHRDVIIVVDDLDAADDQGLALLRALVAGANPPPVAFLLAARDDERLDLPDEVERIAMS